MGGKEGTNRRSQLVVTLQWWVMRKVKRLGSDGTPGNEGGIGGRRRCFGGKGGCVLALACTICAY